MSVSEISQAVKMSLMPPLQRLWAGPNSRPAWVHANAVHAADFKNGEYWRGNDKTLLSALLSTTRASKGWAQLLDGAWREFDNNYLRRTDRGASVHGLFDNKIRNPRGEGGVVGTVGVLNKCTSYNAAPPALVAMGTLAAFNSAVTNITAGGGDANTLFGVVDDTASLQVIAGADPFIAAGLANGWLNGRVYKVDNSAGATLATLLFGGTTGNTNAHSVSVYERGGTGALDLVSAPAFAASATYVRRSLTATPSSGSNRFGVRVNAGQVVYFILFDLIEAAAAAPVPTVVAGAAATGALPTNVAAASVTGVAVQYLGRGTVNGLPAYRVRFSGTATATAPMQVYFDYSTNAAALAGQAWGSGARFVPISGIQPVSFLRLTEWNGGAFVQTLSGSSTATAALFGSTIRTNKGIVTASTTNNVRSLIEWLGVNATVYDFVTDISPFSLCQLAVIEGPELVTNGDFSSATGWTLGSGWSIGSGVATRVPDAGETPIFRAPASAIATGAILKTVFTRLTASAGSFWVRASGAANASGALRTGTGTFTEYLVAPANVTTLQIRASAAGNGTLDDFSIKLVTPGYMPAFPILPAVGVIADSTKLADDVRASNLDWFTAAGLSTGATELAAVTFSHVGDGLSRPLFEYSDGTANNYIRGYVNATDHVALKIVAGGVVQTDTALTASISATNKAYGFGWSAAGGYITNGTETVTFGAVTLPTVTQKRLGGSVTPNFLNDVIRSEQAAMPIAQAAAEAWALAA